MQWNVSLIRARLEVRRMLRRRSFWAILVVPMLIVGIGEVVSLSITFHDSPPRIAVLHTGEHGVLAALICQTERAVVPEDRPATAYELVVPPGGIANSMRQLFEDLREQRLDAIVVFPSSTPWALDQQLPADVYTLESSTNKEAVMATLRRALAFAPAFSVVRPSHIERYRKLSKIELTARTVAKFTSSERDRQNHVLCLVVLFGAAMQLAVQSSCSQLSSLNGNNATVRTLEIEFSSFGAAEVLIGRIIAGSVVGTLVVWCNFAVVLSLGYREVVTAKMLFALSALVPVSLLFITAAALLVNAVQPHPERPSIIRIIFGLMVSLSSSSLFLLFQQPESEWSRRLAAFPVTAAHASFARALLAAEIRWSELLSSLAIATCAAVLASFIAARIFRATILMRDHAVSWRTIRRHLFRPAQALGE